MTTSLADRSAAELAAGFAGGDFDPLAVHSAVVDRMDECEIGRASCRERV